MDPTLEEKEPVTEEAPGNEQEIEETEETATIDETPEPTEEPAESRPPRDQAWWENRAKHFEGEYKRERTRRQEYDKKYGRNGLAGSLTTNGSAEYREPAPTKKIEEIETASEFAEHILQQAKQQVREELSTNQIRTRMVDSEKAAREEFDGKDGMPSYDEMFDKEIKPFLSQHQDVVNVLAKLPDPARAAYTLGLLMNPKYLAMMTKRQQSKAREDLTDQIDEATKKAVTIKNGKGGGMKSSGKKTAAEIDAMSNEEFEKELEAFKNS